MDAAHLNGNLLPNYYLIQDPFIAASRTELSLSLKSSRYRGIIDCLAGTLSIRAAAMPHTPSTENVTFHVILRGAKC